MRTAVDGGLVVDRACLEGLRAKLGEMKTALEESVKLQNHYAGLLNMYDGGQRRVFTSGDEWISRLHSMAEMAPKEGRG